MSSSETVGSAKHAGSDPGLPGDRSVRVTVNGEPYAFESPLAVRELLGNLAIAGRVAVAVNREVVPRSEFEGRQLQDGDRIEILEAVGGG